MQYVIGLMFNERGNHVALIEKNRPEWQAGKLNGIGGKIEQGESPYETMVREFQEETGVLYKDWVVSGCMMDPGKFEIHVFKAFTDKVYDVRSKTDEEVSIHHVALLKYMKTVEDLDWMIVRALEQKLEESGVENSNYQRSV